MRPGEPLLAERYITNPQYGVYGPNPVAVQGTPADDTNEPQVLLLDRNALTFLEEVGEGCFGKVHKGITIKFLIDVLGLKYSKPCKVKPFEKLFSCIKYHLIKCEQSYRPKIFENCNIGVVIICLLFFQVFYKQVAVSRL